jgi:hypothetical protein
MEFVSIEDFCVKNDARKSSSALIFLEKEKKKKKPVVHLSNGTD